MTPRIEMVNAFRARCRADYACLRLNNGGEDKIARCMNYGNAAVLTWRMTRGVKDLDREAQIERLIDVQATLQREGVDARMAGAEAFGDGLYGSNQEQVENFATNMCLAGKRF